MSDRATRAAGEDREVPPAPGSASPSRDPFVPWSRAFLRHAALWLMAAIIGGLVLAGIADSLLHRLAGFFQIVMISLFLSFAIEPAVGYLAKRGWRRGIATGLVFLAILLVAAGLIALLVPAIVTGTRQLIAVLPDLVHNLARYLRPFGIQVNQADIERQVRTYGNRLLSNAGPLRGGVVQVAAGILSGVFQALAIALFTFYMVAQGPQMRKAVFSRFRPDRQRRILFVWERAIEQTGGYFIVGPLSNGNTALLVHMAKAAGLSWDVILGSDISRAYKPSPEAYRKPAAILGLDPGQVMLAAAHNNDLEAARRAGLATAFVARPAEHGPHQARDLTASDNWDLVATSITGLAGQLQDQNHGR